MPLPLLFLAVLPQDTVESSYTQIEVIRQTCRNIYLEIRIMALRLYGSVHYSKMCFEYRKH